MVENSLFFHPDAIVTNGRCKALLQYHSDFTDPWLGLCYRTAFRQILRKSAPGTHSLEHEYAGTRIRWYENPFSYPQCLGSHPFHPYVVESPETRYHGGTIESGQPCFEAMKGVREQYPLVRESFLTQSGVSRGVTEQHANKHHRYGRDHRQDV